MPRSSRSPRQARLQVLLVSRRTAAGLSQEEVARRLRRPQSFVSKYETGERRLDIVELLEVGEVIGFDVRVLVTELAETSPPEQRNGHDELGPPAPHRPPRRVSAGRRSTKSAR
jgi:transcriptional regulator with XRE-family HTH domain